MWICLLCLYINKLYVKSDIKLEIIHYCCFVGNQHLKEVAVCDCESHAATLVRCQFWPGSPERPSVGFHFKLMDLAEKLFLHSQVSVKEFSELILEMSPPMQPNFVSIFFQYLVMPLIDWVCCDQCLACISVLIERTLLFLQIPSLYAILNSGCFEEYRSEYLLL